MILAVDIGNTTTHLGLFDSAPGLEVRGQLRLATGPDWDERERDECRAFLNFFTVEGVVISSVVPEVTGPVRTVLAALTGVEPVTIGDRG